MSDQLKPWYAEATPHEDICRGRFAEAVFAANIWEVHQKTAPEIYLEPEEFFKKTYMTVGLSTTLKHVAAALSGTSDAGDRIISLQTAFGGGKTHTLVALYHLAKSSASIEALAGIVPQALSKCSVAVFTNATCDATQGRQTPEGVHTRTLWGELALQLGGPALYEKVRPNDEAMRVPQGIFQEILRLASPCLILLDELADYCVGAAAVPVGQTTLADQTVSFIQQLEEAVSQVEGAAVVATLPASRLEVAQSEKGQELFSALEKRFQRLGADVKPVADDEIYEVVRARLFDAITLPGETDYPARVARAYQEMYAAHSGEVPGEAAKSAFREQLARSYPFHPALIDALYTRWGSHPDFQRTRGVLRLLASIVGDLWQRRSGNTRTQHFIQPCDVDWNNDAMQAALTRLWGPAYQSVAAADVVGARSNAAIFDEERGGDYIRENIGRGLAAAILLGSFGGMGGRSGFSAKDLKLACSRHGLNWNYLDGALLELENRCFYLHTTSAGSLGKRYWFGTKPTLNKLIVQYRQQLADRNFDEEILEALRSEAQRDTGIGPTWRVIVNPGLDLPEQKQLSLLILAPSQPYDENGAGDKVKEQVKKISSRCGERDRLYRNTLLFLAGTQRGLNRLRQAHRELAALQAVRADYWNQLDTEQQDDLKRRIEAAERSAKNALGPAYTAVMRLHGQEVETCILSDARTSFSEHLGYIWTTLMEDEEWILRRIGSVTLQNSGLIPEQGGIRVKDAVDAFLRYTDKHMITGRDAVVSGLIQACADGLVGLGRGGSPSTLQAKYCREQVPLDPYEEGVWVIPPFEPKKPISPDGGTTGTDTSTGITEPGRPLTPGSDQEGAVAVPRKIKKFRVQGSVPVENYAELFRCFVNPAARMNLRKLRLGVNFEMELPDDQALDPNNPSLKAMEEAARQLGLDFDTDES